MFTHLHNHTEYSMLDGISRIPDLVDRTVELGMSTLAITDHGSLYGAVDFYSECKDRGIKPIIGCETYVAHESRFNRGAEERSPYHLVLLARDNQGYRNLMQLITLAHREGFHYARPASTARFWKVTGEGLICLSGCASAEVPQLLAEEDMDGARTTAGWYREIFGDGYFLELQQHQDVPKLDVINNGLLTLSRDLNIPLVITNDSHYVRQKDAEFQGPLHLHPDQHQPTGREAAPDEGRLILHQEPRRNGCTLPKLPGDPGGPGKHPADSRYVQRGAGIRADPPA